MEDTAPIRPAPGRTNGITLIELMVIIAVIGIVAALAASAYNKRTRAAHRADAQAILRETVQFMARYYSANHSDANAPLPTAVSPKGASGTDVKYQISFTVAPTASAYTVQAVPVNYQAGDPCGALTVSHTGARSAAKVGCW